MIQKSTIISIITLIAMALLSLQSSKSNGAERIGRVALNIAGLKNSNAVFMDVNLAALATETRMASVEKTVRNYSLLRLDANTVSELLNTAPENIRLTFPVRDQSTNISLELYKVDISANGFTLLTSDDARHTQTNKIVHYRGIVEGQMNSVVSISVSNEETMGMIATDKGNYVLGKLENNGDLYVFYNDKDMIVPFSFECGTNTSVQASPYPQSNGISTFSTKCVNWYYEVDYDIFVGKGSLAAVNSYIQGIFNQVSTLYNNDGISITLQTLYVWTTTDPYTGPSTSNYLSQFGSYRTSFAGDLATLIGYAGSGGVAYVNGLCSSNQYKMGYAGISSSYNNVPTYSWTVEVITHEDGHLLGSKHTHDCVWNGNNTRIDGCGPAAGYNTGTCATGPIPVDGTIMSYCHLISAGINFNLGFGPQPAALILNNVNNSNCLVACSTCIPPSQPGSVSGASTTCSGLSQTYSITPVSGATSYTWNLPAGWNGSSISNSITVTAGTSGGNISVVANNSCGSSTARTFTVTASSAPIQPGNITGSTSICQGQSQIYSVSAVNGATSYTWTLPSGWSGTSASNSITVITSSTGGTITVKANNTCGSSAVRSLAVTSVSAPAQPGNITGNTVLCQGTSQIYSVSDVRGATSYNWILPSGWSGTSTTNSITAIAGAAGGTLSVAATSSCGTGIARTLSVSISTAAPARPSVISGIITGACNGTNIPFSVTSVSGVTYNWSFNSTNASIASGQGTNSITANFNSAYISSQLSVTATNGCGTSAVRSVTVKASPATPNSISGSTSVCANQQSVPYNIVPVAGATSYTWSVPSGARINDGNVTSTTTTLTTTATNITVNWKTTAGNVRVKSNNTCSSSSYRSLPVSINCRLAGTMEQDEQFKFTVYPNPASEELNVRFESKIESTVYFRLYDVTGKTLLLKNIESIEGMNISTVNVTDIIPGIYILEIRKGNNKENIKIIIN